MRNKGRYIVVKYMRSGVILSGARFSSKSRARRWARSNYIEGVPIYYKVVKYLKKHWTPRPKRGLWDDIGFMDFGTLSDLCLEMVHGGLASSCVREERK